MTMSADSPDDHDATPPGDSPVRHSLAPDLAYCLELLDARRAAARSLPARATAWADRTRRDELAFDQRILDTLTRLIEIVGNMELRLDQAHQDDRKLVERSNAERDRRLREVEETADRDRAHVGALVDDIARQRSRLDALLRRTTDPEAAVPTSEPAATTRPVPTAIPTDAAAFPDPRPARFYADFEARYRGNRDEIMDRQRHYLDVIEAAAGDGGVVLDVGPGRGEWLELLGTRGIAAYGVDTNEAFVAAAEPVGIDIRLGDAVEHLRGVPERSLAAITAFHIVEHLPFAVLLDLVDAAFAALRPDGVLVIETPNPQNLVVGAYSFHLDPTHVRPIPPPLLDFTVEQAGFRDREVRQLHPMDAERAALAAAPDALRDALVPIADLLFGPQDYAVIARAS